VLAVDAELDIVGMRQLDLDPGLGCKNTERLGIWPEASNLLFSDRRYLIREKNEATGLRTFYKLTQVARGRAYLFFYRQEANTLLSVSAATDQKRQLVSPLWMLILSEAFCWPRTQLSNWSSSYSPLAPGQRQPPALLLSGLVLI
jgi:hypothetical protein